MGWLRGSLDEARCAQHDRLEVVLDVKGGFDDGRALIREEKRNVRGDIRNHFIAVRSITEVQIQCRQSKTIIISDENSDHFSKETMTYHAHSFHEQPWILLHAGALHHFLPDSACTDSNRPRVSEHDPYRIERDREEVIKE